MIYDRTCAGRYGMPGLSQAWAAGRQLYRGLGRLDASCAAASWAEAFEWLATTAAPQPIAEVQFWGHGRFGEALIAGEALDLVALGPGQPHHDQLLRIRARMLPGAQGLWWFRTCETFGTAAGHDFARAFAQLLGCRAAGHTHVIGVWQSGLHTLLPGAAPSWPVDEGVLPLPPATSGRKARIRHSAAPSRPGRPNTISCFHGRIPDGF